MGSLADLGQATTPARAQVRPGADDLATIVELACRAPSVHNTQPWRWRVVGSALELYADRSRALPAADPSGRNLVLSCGAALHHARAAAHSLGWVADVARLPDPALPDLLARIELTRPQPTLGPVTDPDATTDLAAPADPGELRALRERRTDRRRFTSWPVPPERVARLAGEAAAEGCLGEPVVDAAQRFRLDLLLGRAMTAQQGDERLLAEQRAWIDHSDVDGIPSTSVPEVGLGSASQRSRFTPQAPPRAAAGDTSRDVVESSDGLLVLGGPDDSVLSWLRTGEGLSALWLLATRTGVSVVPLSQVVEVDETRHALQHEVLGGRMAPHLVVRIGWQEISRSTHRATPRRPLDDVLVG